jgi:hypothetical protein
MGEQTETNPSGSTTQNQNQNQGTITTPNTHTNVSAQDFNNLNSKVDKLTGLLQGLAQAKPAQAQLVANQQQQSAPKQEPAQPATPATVAGLTEEQVKDLVAENNKFKQKARTSTLQGLAKEKGVELNDQVTNLILSNSKTDDDLKANIDALAKVKPVQKSNPTAGGFKPNGSGEAEGFQAILNEHFGKQNK